MFELDLHLVPTEELWQRILAVNTKTMTAPPHVSPQLYSLYQALVQEYSQRSDRQS
jgi:hypothetical protein